MPRKRSPQTSGPKAAESPATSPGRVGVLRVMLLGAMVLAVAGLGWWWSGSRGLGGRGGTTPAVLPEIPLAGAEPAVAAAVTQFVAAVRAAPDSAEAWGRLGSLLYAHGMRAQSAPCFAVAARLAPREPRWPYLRGLALLADDPPMARQMLAAAIALCGDEPETPRMRLVELLVEDGQLDEAGRQIEAALKSRPGHLPARLAQARLAWARGDAAGTVRLLQPLLRERRTAKAAQTLLASALGRQGDAAGAARAAKIATELPGDPQGGDRFESEVYRHHLSQRGLSNRAQQLLLAGLLEESAPLIERLVSEFPRFHEGWLLRGRLKYLRRDCAGAEADFRRVIDLEPRLANGLFQLGMALLCQERAAEAVEWFERAVREKPDFGPAQFNLAFALARSGRPREAMDHFRETIRITPQHSDAYVLLGDLLGQSGRHSEALTLVEQGLAVAPDDPRLRTLHLRLKGGTR